MAPMAFKHFTPNFERARTFTFVNVQVLDVCERAPPATPTFGCARRNGKRPTIEGIEFRGKLGKTKIADELDSSREIRACDSITQLLTPEGSS